MEVLWKNIVTWLGLWRNAPITLHVVIRESISDHQKISNSTINKCYWQRIIQILKKKNTISVAYIAILNFLSQVRPTRSYARIAIVQPLCDRFNIMSLLIKYSFFSRRFATACFFAKKRFLHKKFTIFIDKNGNICYNILATQLHIAITMYKCVFFSFRKNTCSFQHTCIWWSNCVAAIGACIFSA